MNLYELLTNYKHLAVVDRMINQIEEDDDLVIIDRIIKNEKTYYKISSTKKFCSYTGAISTNLVLDAKLNVVKQECGCLEYYRKKQCVHATLLYASALRILNEERYNKEINKYKKSKLAYEQEIILNDLATDLRTNSTYFKKIHLTPEIYKESNQYYLSLRIAYDKEYMVKSISEFINLIEEKKFYAYGQKLSFIHSYEMLDDESKEFYAFLLGTSHENALKSINIKKSQFLRILEIYHTSKIYYGNEFKKPKLYQINELEKINIILDEESLHLDISKDLEELVCGINNAYFYNDENIYYYHFKKRNEAILFNSLFKCKNNSLWIEANEIDFISNLLPMIKKDIIINDDFYKKYKLPDVIITSYFEYQNNNIVNKINIDVEDKYINTPYVNQILDTYYQLLESFGFIKQKDDLYILSKIEEQYAFLTADLTAFKNYGEVYFDKSIKKIKLKKSERIQIYVSFNVGLLDFKFDSKELSIDEVKAMLDAYHDKKRFVKLKNDVILEVKEEDVKELNNFLEDFNLNKDDIGKNLNKPINYLLKLVEGKSDSIHYDDKIYEMVKNVLEYKNSDILPNETFAKVLRPYQLDAFKWLSMLAEFGFGGILADDMGLGKTLEIISFLASDKIDKPSLIVCPMSLVYNWENECKKWNLNIAVNLIMGSAIERENIINNINENSKSIYITSYDSLRRDIELYNKEFRMIVADEAQYIKNQNALKSTAIKQLKSELRFALTGTPIENGLADLWSIFDYLMPGYLADYNHFKSRYETLIMEDDQETLTLLKKRVQPFILRRTKKSVLTDLPAKTEEVYYCKMEDKQKEIYHNFVEKIKNELNKDGNSILALIMRLRQICITPELIYEEEIASAKLNLAIELINRAISSNHRILLFSQFSSVFPIISRLLDAENISYYIIDGTVPAAKRMELVDSFNEDTNIKVFMISLKAGGTGLNLTGADMVIHLDPWWNVSAENQATDRAYRIGQTKNVHVIKLVCKDSIEEKVMLLQHLKSELAEQVLVKQEKKINLTKKDILELIS